MTRIHAMKYTEFSISLILASFLIAGTCFAKSELGSGISQKWAEVSGFRSARFGMNERDVKKAIKNDFGVGKNKITRIVHPNEKTVSLGIKVPKLLRESGPAKVFYILGYKTRRLIHINLVWGRPVAKNPDPESLVAVANQLRNHFMQKKYQKEGFALNNRLAEGVILVFQGKDRNGRAARLLLSNPKSKNDEKVGGNISLTLSYIEKPDYPDVFRIKEGDF